ncbi:MAG: hypothetical protein LBU89_09335 [Fibromonadaceae bacterium]|jgi:hypothetical protein|nr:hypothetical protein [Fibromonadaceae bacterium]
MQRHNNKVSWNRVILKAMLECKQHNIDQVFLNCEEKFCNLKVPEKEMELRLFALAFYCNKIYNWSFFRSAVFPRFAEILNDVYFTRTARILLEKDNPALTLFWAIFRLSLKKPIERNRYLSLEKRMKEKSLRILAGDCGIY